MTSHPDTEKEFDKEYVDSQHPIALFSWIKTNDMKSFISTHFTDNRLLEEKLEKLTRTVYNYVEKGKCKTEDWCEIEVLEYNQALQDIKNFIKENK